MTTILDFSKYSTIHQQKLFGDRYQQTLNETIVEMFERVAEKASLDVVILGMDKEQQRELFLKDMHSQFSMPAGRPLANLGPNGNNMVFNCYVLGLEDSRRSITQTLADFTEIAAMGGGIGISYSPLRPAGCVTKTSRGIASGPCSFLDVFQSMAKTVKQAGSRGLACMSSLSISHPDIELFIKSKIEDGKWPNTNLSIEISDAFMEAVIRDDKWELKFGDKVYNTVSAARLWETICTYAHKNGEPGILFVDTMNERTPYRGIVRIETSNPCAEQPLAPNSACNLGSVIVSTFVDMETGTISYEGIEQAAYNQAILLDNLIDVSTYPTKQIETTVKNYRPIGIGIMGFADALLYMGIPYGDNSKALEVADSIAKAVYRGALGASTDLAEDRGTFPAYDANLMDFPPRRNITLTSYAPTGSISAFCDVSSGIEPHFSPKQKRTEELGVTITETKALKIYMEYHNLTEIPAHARFSVDGPEANSLTTNDHLAMLKVFAQNCETSVSKTINMPEDATVEDVSQAFMYCWENGIKGCTVYRKKSRKDAPIQAVDDSEEDDMDDNDMDDFIEVVDYTVTPKERPNVLEGRTYKVKPNPNESSIFVTINNYEEEPFEIFFTTSNATHQEYLDGLSRSLTALWRSGINIDFLIEDFCRYESPSGGTFYEYEPGKHKRLKSILDAIGTVIRRHIKTIDCEPCFSTLPNHTTPTEIVSQINYMKCPNCGEYGLNPAASCPTCEICGFSRCG